MDKEGGGSELLANIRRLTVRVLDDLDEGSVNKTLDQAEKRLLSSTGARLLRLWRIVEREGQSKRALEMAGRIGGLSAEVSNKQEGCETC